MLLATIVVSTMSWVVATASPLPRIAVGAPAGVEGVMRVTVAAEMLMHQDHGVLPTTLWCLVD